VNGMYGMAGQSSAGGGVDLSAVPLDAIDATTGWTAADPDSIVSSLTITDGVHKATMAAVAGGNDDYSLVSGSAFDAQRAYINLNDASGARITTEDDCIVYLRLSYETPDTAFDQQVSLLVCEAPASQVAADVNGVGVQIQRQSGTTRWAIVNNTSATIDTSGSNKYVTSVIFIKGGAFADLAAITVDASENGVGTPSRAVTTPTASTNLSLMLSVGVHGTAAVSSGADCQFKAWYKVVKFTV